DSPDPVIGLAPRLVLHSQSYPVLQQAIEDNQLVSFLYHKPLSTQAELRSIEPLTLLTFKDHWLLYGFDRMRNDYRSFLLARIVGKVQLHDESVEPRLQNPAEHALNALESYWKGNQATVRVVPNSIADAKLRRRTNPGNLDSLGDTLSFNFLDLHTLADELAGHGPEVLVLAPQELKEQVVLRLERVLSDHSGISSSAEQEKR
ncbi:MAG: WYL domain-containing protein, partial [Microbacteriaceae bacterium]